MSNLIPEYTCRKCNKSFDEDQAVNECCCPFCKTENRELKRDLDVIHEVTTMYRKQKIKLKIREHQLE